MIEFILPPLLAGASLSLATGSLGCFVVWNRMAFFGETLAHSALLGVVLGLLLQINLGLAVAALALFVALSLWQMQRSSALGNDTLLGILSHSSLALGLVGISLIENTRVNVYSLLVGDLLTVTWQEVTLVLLVSAGALSIVIYKWRTLLLLTCDPELAKAEGQNTEAVRLLLMLLVALVIAVAMRVVGVLLITALLIIPAASARFLSSSPEAMATLATSLGFLSVITGILSAFHFDLPLGPSIVLAATASFILCTTISSRVKTR